MAAEIGAEGSPLSVDVHAFASQGFILTTANNYLASDTTHGSFELSEVGINFTKALTDKLRLGVQLFAQNIGADGNYNAKFDWFYLDRPPRVRSNIDSMVPVDLTPNSAVRRRFTQDVLKRSVDDVRGYWQQRIFSGRDVPPPELDTDDEVVAYVLKHGGAVGYVSAEAKLNGTKVLTVR